MATPRRWCGQSSAGEVFSYLGLYLVPGLIVALCWDCLLLFPDGRICDRRKKLDRLSGRPPKQAPTGSNPCIPSDRLP